MLLRQVMADQAIVMFPSGVERMEAQLCTSIGPTINTAHDCPKLSGSNFKFGDPRLKPDF
jgi:hypothetical protein